MEIKFKKVHTVTDLLISVLIIAAGAGLYFVNAGLGIVIAVCGLLLLLFYQAGYKRVGENILLRKTALDVAYACRPSLKDFLDGKDVEPELASAENSGVVRLEVWFNRAESVAYAQLFDFSNYTYQEATPLVELRGERAARLIAKL